MNDIVIIVAPSEDLHSRVVAKCIESDFHCEALIWNNALFPLNDQITFGIENDQTTFALNIKGKKYELEKIRSIWNRRPQIFNLSQTILEDYVKQFCASESRILFRASLASVNIPVINNIFNDMIASYKPLQLKIAKQSGLKIPRTIMTNQKEEITKFWKNSLSGCVYKTFGPLSERIAETRILKEEDLVHLDKLVHAPTIVQEKIEGRDIRVNIFGDHVSAASVTSDDIDRLDWRWDLTSKWHEHKLPYQIIEKIREFVKNLGLLYGCIDMRKQPDGNYIFFEINPSGQFLFIEMDTGQPLAEQMAKLLTSPPTSFQRQCD